MFIFFQSFFLFMNDIWGKISTAFLENGEIAFAGLSVGAVLLILLKIFL